MGRPGQNMSALQRVWARVTAPFATGSRRVAYPIGNVQLQGALHDPEDALKIATVWRCVSLVSQTVATLPWNIYRRTDDEQGERVRKSPVEWLLHHEASADHSAFEFRRTLIMHTLLFGNGYAEIERDNSNRPTSLWLLDPRRVTPGRDAAGAIVYRVRQGDGSSILMPASAIMHIRGMSYDGITGYSILEVAASSLSTSVALDESLWRFFLNGFRPLGFLKTKGKLSLEGFKSLETRLDEYSGLSKRWKAIPLDQDMDFQPLAVAPEDAQLIDMRKFSSIEVCRWFGVPPHMAYDLERATFSNIESQGRDFLTYGLMPHIIQLEQEVNRKLLSNGFGGLYSKINVNAIVRADMNQRASYYSTMRQLGVMTVNDILRLEEMPTIGKEGDVRVMQAQYQPTGQNPTPPDNPEAPSPDDPQAQPSARVVGLRGN